MPGVAGLLRCLADKSSVLALVQGPGWIVSGWTSPCVVMWNAGVVSEVRQSGRMTESQIREFRGGREVAPSGRAERRNCQRSIEGSEGRQTESEERQGQRGKPPSVAEAAVKAWVWVAWVGVGGGLARKPCMIRVLSRPNLEGDRHERRAGLPERQGWSLRRGWSRRPCRAQC